jgi:hypothetical protein
MADTAAARPDLGGALDRAGFRYCVLHGYESYPQQIKSDVDGVINAGMTPRELVAVFHRNFD